MAPEILFEYVHKDLMYAERIYRQYAMNAWKTRLDINYQSLMQTPDNKPDVSFTELVSTKSYGKIENYYGKLFAGYEYQKIIGQLSISLQIYLPEEQETFDAVCKPKITQQMLEETLAEIELFKCISSHELRQELEPRCKKVKELCNRFFIEYFGSAHN